MTSREIGRPRRSGFPVRQRRKADVGPERSEAARSTGGPPSRAELRGLALLAEKLRNLAGSIGSRPQVGARSNATLAHLDNDGHLRTDGARQPTARGRKAVGVRKR